MRDDRDENRVSQIIDGIYDSVISPEGWADWLETIALTFGATTAFLGVQSATMSTDIIASHNLSSRILQLYGEYYHQCDFFSERAALFPSKACLSEDLYTDAEFANSEIYTDLNKSHEPGIFYVVGSVVPLQSGRAGLALHRSKDSGPFSIRQKRDLQRIIPHLYRGLTLREQTRRALVGRATGMAALDALSQGVIVVARDGNVRHLNLAAKTIVTKRDGVVIDRKGILSCSRLDQTAALHRLIAACTIAGETRAMRVYRPSGLRPLQIVGTKASDYGRDSIYGGQARAILFLYDPETQIQTPPEILRELYGLTRAESQIASDLIESLTIDQIADRRRVKRETIRTHIKELFLKTGTNRQATLIAYLLKGMIPIKSSG
jgi:DNA-binding CsgD family transcriptional regulator